MNTKKVIIGIALLAGLIYLLSCSKNPIPDTIPDPNIIPGPPLNPWLPQ